jgi:hypothetical protein
MKIVIKAGVNGKKKSIFIVEFYDSNRIGIFSLIEFIDNKFSFSFPHNNNRIFSFLAGGTQFSIRLGDIKTLYFMIMSNVPFSFESSEKNLFI